MLKRKYYVKYLIVGMCSLLVLYMTMFNNPKSIKGNDNVKVVHITNADKEDSKIDDTKTVTKTETKVNKEAKTNKTDTKKVTKSVPKYNSSASSTTQNYTVYNNTLVYNGVTLSENDMIMMCTIVSSEAGYCDDLMQKAVAHTILNRFNNDNFPNTMYEITTQENQYTAIHSYFDGQYRDGLYPGSELWNHSMQLCKEALYEYDFTGGAVAYYNPSMIGYNSWFESLQLTYQNQYARFFKI